LLLDRGADPDTTRDISAYEYCRYFSYNPQLRELLRRRGASEAMSRRILEKVGKPIPAGSLDEAMCRPDLADLMEEVRKRLAPFKDRLYSRHHVPHTDQVNETSVGGMFLTDVDFRNTMLELAEMYVKRGVHPNLTSNAEGATLLHEFAVLKNYPLAADAV